MRVRVRVRDRARVRDTVRGRVRDRVRPVHPTGVSFSTWQLPPT